ncbi:hypothetical protein ABG79_01362 [Caloramator mitchellensis]|uniref:UPF0473 protein ABG79_01362 n=1 Tax=Caloramator mitchellensis TaxID=908809 RepID=A0A0R3JTK0_CALMK|nr:DUF1292 domain-containing protein [Caloramator mitchellensis]KRQ86871.1 hypothetical protein ABG79_01362 [Caloramator mitchellensis]
MAHDHHHDHDHEHENVVVLTDENGVETEFEIITSLEVEDKLYYVLYPLDTDDDEAVVLRYDEDENGEGSLAAIEDDEEFDKVARAYEEWLEEEDFEEFEDDEEDEF